MPLETLVDIVVAILLGAVIVYCAILDRRLAVVREGQDSLRELLAQLSGATLNAERAVMDLRNTANASAADLGEKIRIAKPLADELGLLVESGSAVVGRLEKSRSDGAASQPSLLKALREAR